MEEPTKSPKDMTPDERVAHIEALLAAERAKPEFQALRESLKRARRITQADLDFRVD